MNKWLVGLGAGPLAVVAGMAGAQELPKTDNYPERPLTIVSPYGPGGGSDTMARAFAESLADVTGVELRVVNQPGAGGFAAVPDYMARPADGYTILQHVNFLVEGEVLGRVDFSVLDELVPICTANVAYSQIYIRPNDDRFDDWESFVDYARANPGDITVGNVNTEMAQVELLADAVGIEVEQINFSKPTERYASVIGHHVDVLYEQPGDVGSYVSAGHMTPILTLVKGDAPADFQDVPTMSEVALEDLDVIFLTRMFLINRDVPADRLKYLQTACEKAYRSESFTQHLEDSNLDPSTSYLDSESTAELLREQLGAFRAFHGAQD